MGVMHQPFRSLLICFHSRKHMGEEFAREHGSDNNTSVYTNSDSSSQAGTAWDAELGLNDCHLDGIVEPAGLPEARPSGSDGIGQASNPSAPCWLLGPNYHYIDLISSGGHGSVVKAIDVASGDVVAVKLIPRRRAQLHPEASIRELVNHAALQPHRHIVALREAYLTPHHLTVVMDYAGGGDLARRLSQLVHGTGAGLSEAAARTIFQQLAVALDWVHCAGIAHRDVKLDNLLLAGSQHAVQLVDFGWSCTNTDDACCCTTLSGTPEYVAPEVLLRQRGAGLQPTDVWAAGVVLWALVGGGFAFLAPEEERLERAGRLQVMAPRIIAGSPRPLPQQATPALANLLQRMLEADPHERITIGEVLAHPWVAKDMPPGLASLNGQLAAARSGALAVQGLAAAPGRCPGEPLVSSDSSVCCSRSGIECCTDGEIAGSEASGGCCHGGRAASSGCRGVTASAMDATSAAGSGCCGGTGSGSLPSGLPRFGGIAQSPADLRALVQRAAAPDALSLQVGPTNLRGGCGLAAMQLSGCSARDTCMPVQNGSQGPALRCAAAVQVTA